MPKGPRGEKRPADVIGKAVLVMKIATGQIEEVTGAKEAAAGRGRKGGLKGGKARAVKLSGRQRSEIAHAAAQARWKKS